MTAFGFALLARDGAARRGRLSTAHGTVETPCFCTPRIAMHMCSASIITPTPRGLRFSWIAERICEVRCSCV